MSATTETDRPAVGDLVIRRDQRHRNAGVRYWVVFVYGDAATVAREDRQGVREVIPMRDLMRVPNPMRVFS